jgi:hypothetical protein
MMATDYDAPRTTPTDDDTHSIEAFKERAPQTGGVSADLDDGDTGTGFELDAPDLAEDTLDVVVLPVQKHEFTCTECFLVRPHTQHHHDTTRGPVCIDCATA